MSTELDPVDAAFDLLDGEELAFQTVPDVFRWHDVDESERGPGQGQAPHLYVWQPTGGPIERFSADGVLLHHPNEAVEVWAYSLVESEVKQLAEEVVNFFAEFMDNQMQETAFADIQPVNKEDLRSQTSRARTEHYIYRVEIQLERLRAV